RDLGLKVELRSRRFASYTPAGDGGILIDNGDAARTAESLGADAEAWRRFYGMAARVAARVAPTLLDPLRDRAGLRAAVDDETAWRGLFERPVGDVVDERITRDAARGVVLTDALIRTSADPGDPSLHADRFCVHHVARYGRADRGAGRSRPRRRRGTAHGHGGAGGRPVRRGDVPGRGGGRARRLRPVGPGEHAGRRSGHAGRRERAGRRGGGVAAEGEHGA